MKKLLLGLCLVVGMAYGGVQVSSLNGTTGTILAASTNSYAGAVVFNVGNSLSLTLGVGFVCNGTNANTSTWNFSSTPDGVNWTSGFLSWPITPNGTTPVFVTTNLTSLTGVYQVRLDTASNINTATNSAITNLYAVGLTKPPSP